jgi:DNA-directed RNA polymerase subunit M/transcription elongation factor TFIIS
MVEICPDCGSHKVSLPYTTEEGRMTTIYYLCGVCWHTWKEKRYR